MVLLVAVQQAIALSCEQADQHCVIELRLGYLQTKAARCVGFDPLVDRHEAARAALLGCCLGFLPHNFYPARLFMGDSGALLLGLLLAAAMISTMGISPAQVSANPVGASLLPLLVPTAIILLPLLDVALAIVRRTREGRHPWTPDAQHLHHRMLRIGHGHRRAVLLLWLWAAVAALGSISFVFFDAVVAASGLVAAIVVALLLTRFLPRVSVPGHRPAGFSG